MKKETQAIEQLANKALGYLESAEAFSKSELPSFLNEVITYNLWMNGLGVVGGLLLIAGAVLALYKAQKGDYAIALLSLPMFLGGVLMFGCTVTDFLKVLLAPRMFLLEYFRDML